MISSSEASFAGRESPTCNRPGFISRDPTGVVRQTLTALIVWELLSIFNERGEQFSPKRLWRKLQAATCQALFDLGRRYQQNLDPPAWKSSKQLHTVILLFTCQE